MARFEHSTNPSSVRWHTQIHTFAQQFPKAVKAIDCLETGLDDALAVLSLPEKYRLRLRTTNMQERLNEEVGGVSA